MSRQGRYQKVTGNLRVKKVRISDDERFVICHNPEGAELDAAIRARMLARLKEMIDGTPTTDPHTRSGSHLRNVGNCAARKSTTGRSSAWTPD